MFETKEQVFDFIRQEYVEACDRVNSFRSAGLPIAGSSAEHAWATLWLLCRDLGIDV